MTSSVHSVQLLLSALKPKLGEILAWSSFGEKKMQRSLKRICTAQKSETKTSLCKYTNRVEVLSPRSSAQLRLRSYQLAPYPLIRLRHVQIKLEYYFQLTDDL